MNAPCCPELISYARDVTVSYTQISFIRAISMHWKHRYVFCLTKRKRKHEAHRHFTATFIATIDVLPCGLGSEPWEQRETMPSGTAALL